MADMTEAKLIQALESNGLLDKYEEELAAMVSRMFSDVHGLVVNERDLVRGNASTIDVVDDAARLMLKDMKYSLETIETMLKSGSLRKSGSDKLSDVLP
jgi:hypothetical protein